MYYILKYYDCKHLIAIMSGPKLQCSIIILTPGSYRYGNVYTIVKQLFIQCIYIHKSEENIALVIMNWWIAYNIYNFILFVEACIWNLKKT